MSERKWTYYNPAFDCEKHQPEVYVYSPWEGHRRFAYDYVRCIQPSVIVELGSHYGGSAFAFLQAIKDGSSDSTFYAVDTWQGDDFTRSDYNEDIFAHYCLINNTFFSKQHSHTLRMTFDEACSRFADGSIDLLHIDGSHNYDDVKHDYLTWKDKVCENGVIFFHDIGEDLVFGKVMGSHIFWEELKASEPLTLEVPFSNGLGLLFRSESLFQYVKNAVDFQVYQQYYNLRSELDKNILREKLFELRDLRHHRDNLIEQIATLNVHLDKYAQESSAMKDYITQLEKDISGLNDFAAGKERYIQELLVEKEKLLALLSEKDAYASDLAQKNDSLLQAVESSKSQAAQLESAVDALTTQNQTLREHLARYEADVPAMKDYITQLEKDISGLNDFAAGKERYIQELLVEKEKLLALLSEKDAYASNLAQKYNSLMQAVEKTPFHKLWLKGIS